MKRILMALLGGLLIGAFAAQAKLPAPPPKSEAEMKAAAEKAAATKAKAASDLGKAQDRAAANYKRNKGMSPASMDTRKKK